MNTNIYGASNLQFLNSIMPSDINFIKQRIKSLLNESISNADEKVDSDYINDLELLYNDINEIVFNNFIHLNYPRFSLTPHEYHWLKCHPENEWIEYLVYRYRFKMYPIIKKLTKFPVHILIESTSICNLKCTMCFQIDKSFSKNKSFMGIMPWGLFTSIVDQAAEHNCRAITLGSRGEPTLHKRFGNMLHYIHQKGPFDIKINTNATRLSEKLCHDILTSEVATLTLSIDASTKETYEAIRKGADFDKVLKNIIMFNDIRDKHYPNSCTSTRIAGVAVKETQKPEEMEKYWSNYVDQVTIRKEIERWDSYSNPSTNKNSICNLLYERIYVWHDGICNPCDFDYKSYLALGNANEKSISEIWQGDIYNDLRLKHEELNRKCLVPCDRCPF